MRKDEALAREVLNRVRLSSSAMPNLRREDTGDVDRLSNPLDQRLWQCEIQPGAPPLSEVG